MGSGVGHIPEADESVANAGSIGNRISHLSALHEIDAGIIEIQTGSLCHPVGSKEGIRIDNGISIPDKLIEIGSLKIVPIIYLTEKLGFKKTGRTS